MATYAELYALLNDVGVQNRVKFAFLLVARNLRSEDPATPNHANRVIFANRVFAGGLQKVTLPHQMMEVLTSPSVVINGAASTDGDIFSAATAAVPTLVDMETA